MCIEKCEVLGSENTIKLLSIMPISDPQITLNRSGCMKNKSANALALCHPPSASFCSVLAVQWSSRIFTHERYNIPSDILIEF